MKARHRVAAVVLGVSCAACMDALAATHVVVVERMSFGAMPAHVVAGDTIEWRNVDPVPHTATSEAAGFDAALAPGATATTVVSRAGRHEVVCRYHPGMTATLIVHGARERAAP